MIRSTRHASRVPLSVHNDPSSAHPKLSQQPYQRDSHDLFFHSHSARWTVSHSLMRPLPTLRVAARSVHSAALLAAHPATATHRLRTSLSHHSLHRPPSVRRMSSSGPALDERRLHGWGHSVCAVLGGQWGDEGKGKLVDILAADYDVIARFNGGSNAGHTLVVDGRKFAFHLLPCGLLHRDKVNVIGNGVVVHVPTLLRELDSLQDGGQFDQQAERAAHSQRLLISDRAHLLFDFHQTVDGLQESNLKADNIGTTKKGIGPAYASKATRNGIRVGELLDFDHFTRRLHQVSHSTTHSLSTRTASQTPSQPNPTHSRLLGRLIPSSANRSSSTHSTALACPLAALCGAVCALSWLRA